VDAEPYTWHKIRTKSGGFNEKQNSLSPRGSLLKCRTPGEREERTEES